MKRNVAPKLLALVALVGLATVLWAAPVLASAKVVGSDSGVASIPEGTSVDGAAYLGGKTVTLSGDVRGDVYCAAESVYIDGTVEGDVVCGGGTLTIGGTVKGDVKVFGSSVTLSGVVEGDLAAAGGTVAIEESAVIKRDALLAASSVRLDGSVLRDLRFGTDVMEISGLVGRNSDGQTTHLVIVEGAKVNGDVQYWSENQATVYDGTVSGKVTRNEPITYERGSDLSDTVVGAIWSIAFLVVLTLTIVFLVPRSVREATGVSLPKFGLAILIGLGSMFIALPVLIILAVTIIGLPVAMLLLVGYIVLMTAALPLVAYYLGRWMLEGRTSNMFAQASLGALVLGVLMTVPILGALIGLVAFSAGMGMAIYNLRNQYHKPSYSDPRTLDSLLVDPSGAKASASSSGIQNKAKRSSEKNSIIN